MRSLNFRRIAAVLFVVFVLGDSSRAPAQNLSDFEKRVTTHRLANGWTFLILERPGPPVFSFATYVDVGSAQEVPGITGLAHMFEHMAFKGSPRIGTKDYAAEKAALERMESDYQAFDSERRRKGADPSHLKELEKAWRDAQDAAEAYVVKNEFDDVISREGGTGANASTNYDATNYFYSLPANKIELWAYFESDRFFEPVFRQFYRERDVVKEERRLRTEGQSLGRLLEQFVATAFLAHPYHQPVIGYMSDLDSLSISDAEAFFSRWYVPSNMCTAIVGDVKAAEVIPLLEKYFGRIPGGDPPPALRTIEPGQKGEKTVKLTDPAQPIYLEGYHRPEITHPDSEVYGAIGVILGGGRTSRLYRSLVRDKQIAANVSAVPSFPGGKYPTLFVTIVFPSRGHTNVEVRDAVRAEIDRMRTEEVSDLELAMVKARAKTDLVRSLSGSQGLASNLSRYQVLFGDWRALFRSIERLDHVSKADILRVAKDTFTETNRTVGYIETAAAATNAALKDK